MVITLEEVKLYLRVEGDAEDTLITSFIFTAEELCEGILRYSLPELSVIPETVKQAVLYAVAQFYEERDKVDMKAVLEVMKNLLFGYRKESW